ncbi:hypothetical protein [Streptomyces sp. NPDC049944]|uniref:hypothetical protein n=1 Tax=Streptomyces sp. NPDC049944 TaxID=3155657 RepID=UPI003426636A
MKYLGHRARRDAGELGDRTERRPRLTRAALSPAAVDVRQAVAGARLRLGARDVVTDEPGQERRGVDRAVTVVLGRALDELPGVELIELPLHAERPGLLTGVLGLQADELTPAHPGVGLLDVRYELVVPAGQEGGALRDQEGARHGRDRFLRAAASAAPVTASSAPPPLGDVLRGEAGVYRVSEDQV